MNRSSYVGEIDFGSLEFLCPKGYVLDIVFTTPLAWPCVPSTYPLVLQNYQFQND